MDDDLKALGTFYQNAIEESSPSVLTEYTIESAPKFFCPLCGERLWQWSNGFLCAKQRIPYEIGINAGNIIVTTTWR